MTNAFLLVMEELDKEDTPPTFLSFDGTGESEWQIFGGGTLMRFFRRPESKKVISKFERHFQDKRWVDKWSRQYIAAVRGAALSNCTANPEPASVRHWLEEAATELDQEAPVHRAIFALSGITVTTPLTFGPVIVFQMTENEAASVGSSFAQIIAKMLDSDKRKEENLKSTRETISQLKGSACVEVTVSGDPRKANIDAPIIAEPVIDLLQLIATIKGPGHINVVAKALSSTDPPFLLLAADETSGHWGVDMKHAWRTVITEATIAQISSKGFGNLIDAVRKPEAERTPFEEALLTSLH